MGTGLPSLSPPPLTPGIPRLSGGVVSLGPATPLICEYYPPPHTQHTPTLPLPSPPQSEDYRRQLGELAQAQGNKVGHREGGGLRGLLCRHPHMGWMSLWPMWEGTARQPPSARSSVGYIPPLEQISM